MEKRDRAKIKIDKRKEMRTKEISRMIDEGGLGADKYYNIKKTNPSNANTEKSKQDDEETNK